MTDPDSSQVLTPAVRGSRARDRRGGGTVGVLEAQ
jgi:hypothetical protein